MKMNSTLKSLTVNHRILIKLLDHTKFEDAPVVPRSVTQRGIAEALDIRWNHIPRAVKTLKEQGLVYEKHAHVEHAKRRLKTYFLTKEGRFFSEKLVESLAQMEVVVESTSGQKEKVRLYEVNRVLGTDISLLKLHQMISDDGILRLMEKKPQDIEDAPKEKRIIIGALPKVPLFIGRREELDRLKGWIDKKPSGTCVIYGSIGIGKTTLVAKLVENYIKSQSIFWYEIEKNTSPEMILESLSKFYNSFNNPQDFKDLDMIIAALKGSCSVLVFDGYFEAEEDVVELLCSAVQRVSNTPKVWILVTARDTTPFYCRIHNRNDIEEGKVFEMNLKGLDMEETRELLDVENIDGDALKKIHLLTRGNPLSIQLIKKGDTIRLKGIKGFSQEEVNLLMFLKTQNRDTSHSSG
jgi:DNA-binding MarR family transcriptional regulator